MAKKKIRITEERIDPQTGEIISVKQFLIVDKNKDKDFIKVYKACTKKVLTDLQAHESIKLKMLWWFMDRLHERPFGEPQIYVSTKELAVQLNCSEIAIKKARTFLLKEGYIIRYTEPSSGKMSRNYYILNPDYVFKGNIIEKDK
ncbi:MAG: replication/maintenance protein RepL [Desulfonauticus sp.]|nr:replication/maintenance protein RepL [Desulfonauticus sp.]